MAFFEVNYDEMRRVMDEITFHRNAIERRRKQREWIAGCKKNFRGVEVTFFSRNEGPGDKQQVILDSESYEDIADFLDDILMVEIADRKKQLDELSTSLQSLTNS